MRRIAIAAFISGIWITNAIAQGDGPDYFRITGLQKADNVNVRSKPDEDAKIVGKIPKNADGIKNLGCNRGGLTQKQWDKASAAKKKAALRKAWCEVEYESVKGWVLSRFLAEGTSPAAPQQPETPAAQAAPTPQAAVPPMQGVVPSFDCAKAEKNAEKLVCGDAGLAALDREAARLYALAADALNATPGFEQLLDTQRKWLGQRNTCFDRDCVAELYVSRVHQLRMGYADARKPNDKSISFGPLLARCEGVPVPIALSFVNAEPGYAYVGWTDRFLVLPQVPSGSGTRYEGSFATLATKGEDARIKLPDMAAEAACKLMPGG